MVFRILLITFLGTAITAAPQRARAEDTSSLDDNETPVRAMISEELAKSFPNAQIECKITSGGGSALADAHVRAVRVEAINPRGEVRATAETVDDNGVARNLVIQATFAAWVDAPVAVRRIAPGEKITQEAWRTQHVNVAVGQAREFRGVMVPPAFDFNKVQARQTILDGQFLTTTALEKIPDIRRGDMVQVVLKSGDLSIATQATVQEPGYLDQNVHVLTTKTKRELVGQLRAGNRVEVQL